MRPPARRSPGARRGPSRRPAASACRPGWTSPRRTGAAPGADEHRVRLPAATSPGASESASHRLDRSEPQPVAAPRRPGARGRGDAADPAVDHVGGQRPVDAGVGGLDPRREADALGRLRLGDQGAGGDAVEGRDQQARAADGEPAEQVAGGVPRADRLGDEPNTGPVSSPASSRKVEAPVSSSPAMIACCTGAAPRQAGSSEKCRLTQPWRGRSRAAGGTRAP